MTAKVTAARMPTPGKGLGVFHCKYFNMFVADDLEEYRSIRQRDNDGSSGLAISMMRELTRKVRDETRTGEDVEIHEEEFPYVYIEWWEKAPKRGKGDSNEEQKSAKTDWME